MNNEYSSMYYEFMADKDAYMAHVNVEGALNEIIRAALDYARCDYYSEESPDSAASAEYAKEKLQIAARYLTLATEASDRQPVGWHTMTVQEVALAHAIYEKVQLSPTPILQLVLRPKDPK